MEVTLSFNTHTADKMWFGIFLMQQFGTGCQQVCFRSYNYLVKLKLVSQPLSQPSTRRLCSGGVFFNSLINKRPLRISKCSLISSFSPQCLSILPPAIRMQVIHFHSSGSYPHLVQLQARAIQIDLTLLCKGKHQNTSVIAFRESSFQCLDYLSCIFSCVAFIMK